MQQWDELWDRSSEVLNQDFNYTKQNQICTTENQIMPTQFFEVMDQDFHMTAEYIFSSKFCNPFIDLKSQSIEESVFKENQKQN